MPGIVLFPTLLEQALLGEGVLGVEHDDARIPVSFGLEHVRHHRDALVGTGRTTIGIGWGDHHDDPAVLDRVELSLEQLGLRPRLPGVRHDLRSRLGITRDRLEFQIDAGRHHQPVVCQLRSVGEADALLVAIDRLRRLMNELHAVFRRQRVIGMEHRLPASESAEIEVRVEAGDELPQRLDQRDLDRAVGIPRHVFCNRGAARTSADDHQLGLGLRQRRHRQAACRDERGRLSQELAAIG